MLDEPVFHAEGQRDVKRFLEERLPLTTQVVYVTHIPAMIDPYNLEQVRQVEFQGDMKGTKVAKLAPRGDQDLDLLEPVRSAIGASLVTSLVFNKLNVLVEGAADKPILEGAFGALEKEISETILINGSVSESKAFLPRFYQKSGLPYAIYVDADSSGRELTDSLKRLEIPANKIVDLRNTFSGPPYEGRDFELEDLIGTAFYHRAVKETCPEQPVEMPRTDITTKRTKYYEELFRRTHGIGFCQRRVAETLKKLILEGERDPETLDRLKKLTTAIRRALEGEIARKEIGSQPSCNVPL